MSRSPVPAAAEELGLPPRESKQDRRFRRLFFALLALVYFLPFPFLLPVNNPNENVRVYMTMALVEHGTFRIDASVARHGWTNDMAKVPPAAQRAASDGTPKTDAFYSVKSPGVSYLGVPAYAAFLATEKLRGAAIPAPNAPVAVREDFFRRAVWWLRIGAVQLPCFLFLLFFERFLRRFAPDPSLRYPAVVACGLGTNYLAYALLFASHALFAATAFTAFALVTAARLDRTHLGRLPTFRGALLAGLFAGLITLTDYQGFLLSVLVALYALCVYWRPKHLVGLALGGILPALPMLLFHARAFGSPFTPGHKFCETPEFAQKHAQGFYGFSATPDWNVFGRLSASFTYGFFGTSSFMWLALPAILFLLVRPRALLRGRGVRRLAVFVATLMMAALFLALSAANNWRGGWTVGPRLLGAAPPFFAFLVAWGAARIARNRRKTRFLARASVGGLAAAAVLQSGLLGVLCNTVPEDVARPVADLAIPLVRYGFVPHTLLEPLGLPRVGFALVLGALGLLAILPIFRKNRDERWPVLGGRVLFAAAFFVLGAAPAFAPSFRGEPARTDAKGALHYFVGIWEPKGLDARALLLARHANASDPATPEPRCLPRRLATVEHALGFDGDADRHNAEADQRGCP